MNHKSALYLQGGFYFFGVYFIPFSLLQMSDKHINVNKAGELLKGYAPDIEKQAVNGDKLLEIIFPPECRPTLRWLRKMQSQKKIPYVKIGRFVFFFPDQVREALLCQQSSVVRGGAR